MYFIYYTTFIVAVGVFFIHIFLLYKNMGKLFQKTVEIISITY